MSNQTCLAEESTSRKPMEGHLTQKRDPQHNQVKTCFFFSFVVTLTLYEKLAPRHLKVMQPSLLIKIPTYKKTP